MGVAVSGSLIAASPISGRPRVVIVRSISPVRVPLLLDMLEVGLMRLTSAGEYRAALSCLFRPEDRIGVKVSVMPPGTHLELANAMGHLLHTWGLPDERLLFWDRTLHGFGERGMERLKPGAGFDDAVSRPVTRFATSLVNLPRLKAHWLSGMSGALKNWAGAVDGINIDDKDTLFPIHGDHCARVGILQALPQIRSRCRLIVMDALRPLCSGSPHVNERYFWDARCLIFGTDPVAVDRVGLELLQEGQKRINCQNPSLLSESRHIFIADERLGLGESRLSEIDICEEVV